jgi:hypothetical protein
VPPKILPFKFEESAQNEGAFAQISCIVPTGDLPMRIVWQMNGADMSSDGVSTLKLNSRSSVLTIDAVTYRHRGEYSCVASNSAGQERYSSVLIVKGTQEHAFFFSYLHKTHR